MQRQVLDHAIEVLRIERCCRRGESGLRLLERPIQHAVGRPSHVKPAKFDLWNALASPNRQAASVATSGLATTRLIAAYGRVPFAAPLTAATIVTIIMRVIVAAVGMTVIMTIAMTPATLATAARPLAPLAVTLCKGRR